MCHAFGATPRPLLLDSVASPGSHDRMRRMRWRGTGTARESSRVSALGLRIQQSAALALGRMANYSEELAESVGPSGLM